MKVVKGSLLMPVILLLKLDAHCLLYPGTLFIHYMKHIANFQPLVYELTALTKLHPHLLYFLQYFVVDDHQQHKHHQVVGPYPQPVRNQQHSHMVYVVSSGLYRKY